MHEFTALRARAKERRDLAIKAARLSYEAAMTAIAELENRLSVGMTSRTQSQTRLNFGLPLSSRAFTIVEIMEGLEALDPAHPAGWVPALEAGRPLFPAPPHEVRAQRRCR